MFRARKVREATLILAAIVVDVGLAALAVAGAQTSVKPYMPQWQTDAGGHAQFEVASVKQAASDIARHANVETSGNSTFVPTGGLYSVNVTLHMFITFAYKLNNYGWYSSAPQLPKWANEMNFDVEARAPGNPTKDQYRLMVQSLLADRFKLIAHWEAKPMPVNAIVLKKNGKLGPRLQPHSDGVPCPSALALSGLSAVNQKMVAGGFPERCGMSLWSDSGRWHIAGRNVSIAEITDWLYQPGDRPYLDETGLKGKYDFSVEWQDAILTHQVDGPQSDSTDPTMVEALKNQLGFKVVKAKSAVETLIIDHIEMPSPN